MDFGECFSGRRTRLPAHGLRKHKFRLESHALSRRHDCAQICQHWPQLRSRPPQQRGVQHIPRCRHTWADKRARYAWLGHRLGVGAADRPSEHDHQCQAVRRVEGQRDEGEHKRRGREAGHLERVGRGGSYGKNGRAEDLICYGYI